MVLTGSLSNSYFSYDIHIIFIIKRSDFRPVGIGGSGGRAEIIPEVLRLNLQISIFKLQIRKDQINPLYSPFSRGSRGINKINN